MPTGYTADIYDNKDVSFRDFVMKCTSAFGARLSERDNSPSAEYRDQPYSTYYVDQLNEAILKYNKFNAMTDTDFDIEYEAHVRDINDKNARWKEGNEALAQRYNDMLDKVRAWEPPTDDHVRFKEFMIEQLDSSIKRDCYEHVIEVMDRDTYIARQISNAEWAIDYYMERVQKHIELTRSSRAWVNAIQDSL